MSGVLPAGTVTFVFTDLEGSTALWERAGDAMRGAVARHDALLAGVVQTHGGVVVKTTGDGMLAAFGHASDALAAAVGLQLAMGAESFEVPLSTRVGLCTGEASPVDGDYHAPVVNRAARVMAAAHGGQVLVAASTAAVAGGDLPAGVSLVDLGAHRLRDLSRPEQLFQVAHPDLHQDFPSLRTAGASLGNLPMPPNPLLGRDRELVEIEDALTQARAVTLIGVGGVGKTRLAVEVSRDTAPDHRDGVWLCELAPVRDPGKLPEAVAGVFGIEATAGQSVLDSLLAFLREEQCLLVLDNCEHLVRAAAEFAHAVVSSCPDVKVLATSREGLGVPGERLHLVAPLPVPDAERTGEGADDSPAVRLFVERAQAQRPDFRLDDENRSAIVSLCRRLDGLPLAIELAAARVGMMSPTEILERIDRRFRLLSGGDRIGVERHQTMRAAVDWSFELLDEAEQRLLTRLSVFSGGWTLQAAETVCSDDVVEADEVLDLLGALVARSLVATDPGVSTRYRLLETIRQYAEEHLANDGQIDRWRSRHLEYFVDFVAEVGATLQGPNAKQNSETFTREYDNIREAFATALRDRNTDGAIRLVTTVPGSARTGFHMHEPLVLDSAPVLGLPDAAGHPRFPQLLILAGYHAIDAGDFDGARRCLAEFDIAFDDHRASLDPRTIATLACLRAHFLYYLPLSGPEIADLVEDLEVALEQLRQFGDPHLELLLMGDIADLRIGRDPDGAVATASAAMAMADRLHDSGALVRPLCILSIMAALRGDATEATTLIERAEASSAQNPIQLGAIAFAAAHAGAWDVVRRCGAAALHLQRRTPAMGPHHTIGIVNIVARGLADADPEGAATVLGAARTLMREAMSGTAPEQPTSTTATEEPGYVETLYFEVATRARRQARDIVAAAIGADALRQHAARADAMSRTQIINYLGARVQDLEDPTHSESQVTPADDPEAIDLTSRQLEVAELVARGLSNKAIADKLNISAYTVETHVRNILERLDATSRTQIVSWWMARTQ